MSHPELHKKSNMLLEGPIGRTLVRLALPMVFGMAAIVLFNIVDTFYVGRAAGSIIRPASPGGSGR